MYTQAPGAEATEPSRDAPSPELLICHWPALILAPHHHAAATELTHLTHTLGGVHPTMNLPTHTSDSDYPHTHHTSVSTHATAFVDDLGTWLSYRPDNTDDGGYLDSEDDAQVADNMELIGTDLLVHAVRAGCVEVAQLIVGAMVSRAGVGVGALGVPAAGGEQAAAWLAAAARPAATRAVLPLLHAAMASGKADMLEKVLRCAGPSTHTHTHTHIHMC